MTHYFDDLLRDANGHTGTDDLWAPAATSFDLWSFTFKAAPKKGLTIESGLANKVDQKDDKETHSQKTWTKIGMSVDCHKIKTGFAFESEKFAASASHTIVDDADWKVTAGASVERKPAKGDWKAKVETAVRSPDLNGVRAWFNLSAEKNNKDEVTLTPKLNLNYQDFHVGVAACRVNEAITKTYGQFVVMDKDNQYWARADHIGKTAGFGCSIDEKNRTHSHELIYSWDKDFKGLKGFPVEMHHGGEYECSENTNLSWNIKHGANFSYAHEVSHKVDKNWTVGITQQFDNSRKGTKLPMYDVGFNATYKL